jgi:hypothetical protein
MTSKRDPQNVADAHALRLDSDHRPTLQRIFDHPASGNIEWRQVRSLLEALDAVTEEHNGKLRVRLGEETEVLQAPHTKDVDPQMIVDLRRMLRNAGALPVTFVPERR